MNALTLLATGACVALCCGTVGADPFFRIIQDAEHLLIGFTPSTNAYTEIQKSDDLVKWDRVVAYNTSSMPPWAVTEKWTTNAWKGANFFRAVVITGPVWGPTSGTVTVWPGQSIRIEAPSLQSDHLQTRWAFNNAVIPGATNRALVVPSATHQHDGFFRPTHFLGPANFHGVGQRVRVIDRCPETIVRRTLVGRITGGTGVFQNAGLVTLSTDVPSGFIEVVYDPGEKHRGVYNYKKTGEHTATVKMSILTPLASVTASLDFSTYTDGTFHLENSRGDFQDGTFQLQ